jgi:hypothetical protein
MNLGRREIQVDMHYADGSTELGRLIVDTERPKLVRSHTSEDMVGKVESFRLLEEPDTGRPGVHRYLYPAMFTRQAPYSTSSPAIDDMYPPSSNMWITRMVPSGEPALYSVFAGATESDPLLVIADRESGQFLEVISIKPYEAPILRMKTDLRLHFELRESVSSYASFDPFAALSGPAPSISRFESLVGEAGVSFTYHPDSLDATLDTLVPSSFPEDFRREVKAFYANVVIGTMPRGDPLEFENSLSKHPILKDLLIGHVRCIEDGVKPPPYIRVFNEAANESLGTGSVPLQGEIEAPPWMKGLFKIFELFPSWFHRIKKHAQELSKAKVIPLRFPAFEKEESESNGPE